MKHAISRILARLPMGRRKLREVLCDPERPALLRFDPSWYMLAYPEVGEAIRAGRFKNAEDHYFGVGAEQQYSPNIFFNERFYRDEHPDVVAAIEAGHYCWGFHHFVLAGFDEGRRPNELIVDPTWYLETYGDVAADIEAGLFRDPDEHYRTKGAIEGRDPHPAFSENWYRATYEEEVAPLIAAGRVLCGYQHFLEHGLDRGFHPHPDYREEAYRRRHPDVDTKIRQGHLRSGYRHLIDAGFRDGRAWRQARSAAQVKDIAGRRATNDLVFFLESGRVMDFSAAAPVVSIILVLYNRAELTFKCLESLLEGGHPPFELIIFDNHSTDLTGTLLSRIEGATIVRSDENLGFIKGSNAGAGRATADVLLFLNNDAEVRPGAVSRALATLGDDPGTGAVGGLVIGIEGLVEEAGCTVWRDGTTHAYGAGDTALSGAYRFRREVDYCSGAFLMLRRLHFDTLGGFSSAFEPAYYEDADLCFRLQESLGLKTVFEPGAVISHFGSASAIDPQDAEDLARRNRAVFTANHARRLATHEPSRQANVYSASNRRASSGRALVIADAILGEADHATRAQEVVSLLIELGCTVTVYAATAVSVDRAFDLPTDYGLEVIAHLGLDDFGSFWRQRSTAYQIAIVSQTQHMAWLQERGFTFDDTRLVLEDADYRGDGLRRTIAEALEGVDL